MSEDFGRAQQRYRRVARILGARKLADTTHPHVVYQDTFPGGWVPGVLLSHKVGSHGTVGVLTLSSLGSNWIEKGLFASGRSWSEWPGIGWREVPIDQVRVLPGKDPAMQRVLVALDTFFAGRVPEGRDELDSAIRVIDCPDWDLIGKKLPPPEGTKPLELPLMGYWQRERKFGYPDGLF